MTALDGLDLTVRRGELFVLLGGSGSGKTTLLRAVGGFVRPAAGSITPRWPRSRARMPPHRRQVNTVFQSGALFPHLSVAGNIGFGPRQRSMARAAVRARVTELLALVRLEGSAPAVPTNSRVASNSALRWPAALPRSPRYCCWMNRCPTLDRGLRARTAAELTCRLQKRLGTTFIQVTHDQQEALTMADRIEPGASGPHG